MATKPKRRITQSRKSKSNSRVKPVGNVRNFDGAKHSRLTADWVTGEGTADKHIYQDVKTLRERARDFERNESYSEAFLRETETNVVGHKGFGFKPLARKVDLRAKGGLAGKIDTAACEKIADAWEDFSKKGNFDVTRQHSRAQFERLSIRSIMRDGGVLVRLVDAFPKNAFGFAVQGIETDALDPTYTDANLGIHMSIEFDEWEGPVAYWLRKMEKGSFGFGFRATERFRVEAENMLHLFTYHRFSQSQGYSAFAPVMTPLRHLAKYEEAEVIAAREQANKIGFFETTEQGGYTGEEDENGNIKAPSGPGQWEQLPFGVKANLIDPTHPNGDYPAFRKAQLQKACAAWAANYNVIGKDLEGVSFSSIRQGVLSERDAYKVIQSFMIESQALPVFHRWLRMALMTGKLEGLNLSDYDRLAHAEFSGRTWPWVDPLKDIQAAKEEILLSISSRQSVARDRGKDFSKLVKENEDDQKAMEAAGLLTEMSPAVEPVPVTAGNE